MQNQKLEVWLRGQLPDMPALLQPVAHALLQAQEEIHALMQNFDEAKLWERPSDVASVGFHLQHLSGVLDRLFTYAEGQQLNNEQLRLLKLEEIAPQPLSKNDLLARFDAQIEVSLAKLADMNENDLTKVREVGRSRIPSTMIGLLVHAAEHTMRHVGQLSVTIRVLR